MRSTFATRDESQVLQFSMVDVQQGDGLIFETPQSKIVLIDGGDNEALILPSIGSERKTHFPHCHRFFDPGVCSRSGWAISS